MIRLLSIVLLVVFSLSVLPVTAKAQKKVLFEKFTNAYCGVCPDATLDLQSIVEQYPDVIWISHNKPVTWTDNPLTNERSSAIYNELGVQGVPTGMVDRTVYNNSITLSRNFWESRILEHLNIPAKFELGIDEISYDTNNRALSFNVNAKALADLATNDYRISVYMVEDSVYGTEQHSYWNDTPGHPLEGKGDIIWEYAHRNVVRTILDDHWGTVGIISDTPSNGESFSHEYSYTVPQKYNPENMSIVAMVYTFDESSNYPNAVDNATRIYLNDLGIQLTNTNELADFTFDIFPNPSSEFIQLNTPEIADQVYIFQQDGQLVKTIQPTALSTTISLDDVQNGAYQIVVSLEGVLKGLTFTVLK